MICPLMSGTEYRKSEVTGKFRQYKEEVECQRTNCVFWVIKNPPIDIEGCAVKVIAGALVATALALGAKE